MTDGDIDIRPVIRWETGCCGYCFNTSAPGTPSLDNAPMTVTVHGRGTFITGECPGCGSETPRIEKLGDGNDHED